MNLQQAELEKRNKELDAREAFIDTKQKLLEGAPLDFKVYEARKQSYENQETQLVKHIKTLNSELQTKQADITKQIEAHNQQLASVTQDVQIYSQELTEIKDKIKQATTELAEINKEVKRLEAYSKEQEKLIELAVAEGNERILELKDGVADLEDSITALTTTKTQVEAETNDKVTEQEGILETLTKSIDDLGGQKDSLERQIEAAIKRNSEKAKEYTRISNEIDAKMTILKEKEESIIAKQEAYMLDKQALDQDKRRFASTRSLYDV